MNKKNFCWNVVGSLTNAATSLFLLIIVKRVNGANLAGVFSFAFTFSLLVQVIGSYSGRSYQVTETDDEIFDSDYVYCRFFTCMLMLIFSALFLFLKNYSFNKNLIIVFLIFYRVIESISDVLYGIIQRNEKLYQVGISLFLKGFLMVFFFLLVDMTTNNLLLSILILFVVNILLLLFYDCKNVKKCSFVLNKFNKNNLIKILKGGFFVFVFYFLIQYVLNAPKYSIDNYLSSNDQFIFGILLMPSTLIGLLSQFFVQPFLNEITAYVKDSRYNELNKLNIKISFLLVICLIFIEIVAYFVGVPVLNFVYNTKLEIYKNSLLIIVFGAMFFGLSYLISTSLIAMRKNFIQAIIYLFVSIFAFFISDIFVRKHQIFGASLSYLITMVLLVILYVGIYVYYVIKEGNKNEKSIDNNSNL